MIGFAGKMENGFFCQEIATKRDTECCFIKENQHIEEQAKEILRLKEEISVLVVDIQQYTDEPELLEEWILKIKEAIRVQIIIHCPGYAPQSRIISGLYHKGIKNFIFGYYLSQRKEELELAMDGYFEHFGYESRGISFEEETEEEQEESQKQIKRSIGVAGAVARMGTTTQAIQIIKYLLFHGYKAAYIQMNAKHWVEDLAEAYSEAEHDKDEGCVSYQSVDMYYKVEKLQDILKKNYDFFVYDYGTYSDHDFNKVSFLEKDIQIFVVGSSPGEFEHTYKVISSNFYNNVFYIFNFTAKTEEKDLLELMEEKAKDTFFAGDARDPFSYDGGHLYDKMIPLEVKLQKEKKSKKFAWKWKK